MKGNHRSNKTKVNNNEDTDNDDDNDYQDNYHNGMKNMTLNDPNNVVLNVDEPWMNFL